MSAPSSSVKANKMPAKTAKTAKPVVAETVVVPVVAAVAAPAPVAETRTADAVLTSLQETLKTLKSDLTSRLAAVSHDLVEVSKAVKRELLSLIHI